MDMYWAAKPGAEIGAEIMKRVEAQKKYLEQSGMLADLRKSNDQFHGNVNIEDVDQSLKAININHYASYVRNIHNMVTSSRSAWEAQAVNTDLESQSDTQLAGGLLDYYMREKHIETKLTESCLKALYLREGWISIGWNATGGEVYGVNPETQNPIYEGDFVVNGRTLTDITRDIRRKDMSHQWYIEREFENKWDIAAKFPELAEKITSLVYDEKTESQYEICGSKSASMFDKGDCDLIPTYTLYHDRSDAVKGGRMTKVLNDEITLFDGELPYKRIYLFPITTGVAAETGFGHSSAMDLLPVQDAFNLCVSSILTNIAANGVQNFQVPKGAAPHITQLMDGMNVWETDPKAGGELRPMELLKTAPEVYTFASFLIDQGDLISNVSQIGRGNAPTNMSGTAMALLQQQAIQSTSGAQTSYTLALENVGTALIELLQTFAVVPRLALIAGKSKRSMMKEFSNKDLKGIGRVFVNRANPLTKTGAGRMEIANNLLNTPPPQPGSMIKTPEQYLGVLTTGNLEPLYQYDNSQRMLILSENEMLMEGKPVQGVFTDDDAIHVLEHDCVLHSPEARENPQVVQATLDHIQWHINNAKGKDPAMAAMLKQQSFFQAPPPMMPPQGGQPVPGPATEGPGPMPPPQGEVDQANLPQPAQPPNPNAFNQGVQ
jgi:hypothetical protein